MTEQALWLTKLRDASFRGVAFHVMSNEASFGRRSVTHEYPLKDKPFVEDLGKRARTGSIEAIIIGADYMTGRDALINAIEQAGGGTLVHPYYGEMQVTLTDSARISETSEQGGMCRISFSFVEAGDVTYPAQTSDTQRQVLDQADVVTVASTEGFTNAFGVDGMPAFVNDSAGSSLTDALTQISSAGSFPFADAIGLSDFNALLGGALGNVQGLLNAPSTLAQTLFNAIGSLRQLAPNARDAFGALVGLFDFGSDHPPVVGTTPVRISQVMNESALVELVQTAAVVNAAVAITDVVFFNATEAQVIRDDVVAALENIALTTSNDALFSSLQDLRAIVVRDIQLRTANLARQIDYTPKKTVPACVLAYQLYGDVNRENEILSLNRIVHPGFVPGLLPIKVLANV